VHHMIPSHRQTTRYIWQYCRAHGYDFPVVPLTGPGIRVGSVPFKLVHRAARRRVGARYENGAVETLGLRRRSTLLGPLEASTGCENDKIKGRIKVFPKI
jgi:hypothetical protein